MGRMTQSQFEAWMATENKREANAMRRDRPTVMADITDFINNTLKPAVKGHKNETKTLESLRDKYPACIQATTVQGFKEAVHQMLFELNGWSSLTGKRLHLGGTYKASRSGRFTWHKNFVIEVSERERGRYENQ